MQKKWIERFIVHSYDVDANRRLTLESLCGLFQEAAWNHAEKLHIGYSELRETKKIWVLSRLAIEIKRMPQWGECLQLHTWPRKTDTVTAFRDFEIFDKHSNNIVCGSSAWLIIDEQSRRPQRVQKYLSDVTLFAQGCLKCEDPPKLAGENDMEGEAVNFKTAYSDIDMNCHVNNARYVAWAFNTYSSEFHRKYRLKDFTINYLAELVEDETAAVFTVKMGELTYRHCIVRLQDNATVCRISATWQQE